MLYVPILALLSHGVILRWNPILYFDGRRRFYPFIGMVSEAWSDRDKGAFSRTGERRSTRRQGQSLRDWCIAPLTRCESIRRPVGKKEAITSSRPGGWLPGPLLLASIDQRAQTCPLQSQPGFSRWRPAPAIPAADLWRQGKSARYPGLAGAAAGRSRAIHRGRLRKVVAERIPTQW